MNNEHQYNLRNYPAKPKTEIIHKPVALTSATGLTILRSDRNIYSAINPREDDWDSEEQAWPVPVVQTLDDANAWGDLDQVTTESNVIVSPTRKPVKNSKDPSSYRSDEYYSAIFAPDVEKFTWLIPGVLAGGPHPFFFSFATNLKPYKEAGFKAILSVYDEPLEMNKTDGFQYYFIPTEDGQACNLTATCNFIENMEKINKPVFVHCFAGSGRTGTVLAAYLMYKNWLTADEAISYVKLKYSKYAIETTHQEDALHRFALNL